MTPAKVALIVAITIWCLFGTLAGGGLAQYAWSNGHGVWEIMTAFVIGFFGWPVLIVFLFG